MAITLVQGPAQVQGSPPTGPIFTDACAPGYLIVVGINISGGSYTGISSTAVTDNVNAGAYTGPIYYEDATYESGYAWFYMVCNASGVPTLTVNNAGAYVVVNAAMFNDFVGTPTLVSGDTYDMTAQDTANPSWAPSTSEANELLLVNFYAGGNYWSVSPSNYTEFNNSGLPQCYFDVMATAGSLTFTGTLGNGAGGSSGLAIGIYDASAPPPSGVTVAWWT